MICMSGALNYSDGHQFDLNSNRTGSTIYNATGGTSTTTLPNTVYQYGAGSRLTSTFDSATSITTTYAYKPNTNYVRQETVTSTLSPVTSPLAPQLLQMAEQLL